MVTEEYMKLYVTRIFAIKVFLNKWEQFFFHLGTVFDNAHVTQKLKMLMVCGKTYDVKPMMLVGKVFVFVLFCFVLFYQSE